MSASIPTNVNFDPDREYSGPPADDRVPHESTGAYLGSSYYAQRTVAGFVRKYVNFGSTDSK